MVFFFSSRHAALIGDFSQLFSVLHATQLLRIAHAILTRQDPLVLAVNWKTAQREFFGSRREPYRRSSCEWQSIAGNILEAHRIEMYEDDETINYCVRLIVVAAVCGALNGFVPQFFSSLKVWNPFLKEDSLIHPLVWYKWSRKNPNHWKLKTMFREGHLDGTVRFSICTTFWRDSVRYRHFYSIQLRTLLTATFPPPFLDWSMWFLRLALYRIPLPTSRLQCPRWPLSWCPKIREEEDRKIHPYRCLQR